MNKKLLLSLMTLCCCYAGIGHAANNNTVPILPDSVSHDSIYTGRNIQPDVYMRYMDQDLVGVWRITNYYNGFNFLGEDFKVYSADHKWYSIRINEPYEELCARGTWKVMATDTIVEHNDYSIAPSYSGRNVYLAVVWFRSHRHIVTFKPFDSNQYLTFDNLKVPEVKMYEHELRMNRDEPSFAMMNTYTEKWTGMKYFRTSNRLREEIAFADMPADTKNTLDLLAKTIHLQDSCSLILRLHLDEQGHLLKMPDSLLRNGSTFTPAVIYYNHFDLFKNAQQIENLYLDLRQLCKFEGGNTVDAYCIDIPITCIASDKAKANEVDLEKGITIYQDRGN